MPAVKTETLTFRILPEIKDVLRQAAAQEHRSLANMLEVMIRDDRRRHPATASDAPSSTAGTSSP